jgi:hypothetical protein
MSGAPLSDRQDRLLDVCLEEVLAGVQPPDLSDRILRALAARQAALNQSPLCLPDAAPEPILLGQPATSGLPAVSSFAPRKNALSQSERRLFIADRLRRQPGLPLALAASLLLALGGYWLWSSGQTELAAPQMAADSENAMLAPVEQATKNNSSDASKPSMRRDLAIAGDAPIQSPDKALVADGSSRPAVAATNDVDNSSGVHRGSDRPADATVSARESEFDASTAGNAVTASSLDGALSTSGAVSSATADEDVIAIINRLLSSRWKEAGVRPSPAATEAEWCRRVYLDVIGRIPTIEELEAFLVDSSRKSNASKNGKRAKLVERLLESDGYVESYARFWTTVWTNWLIGRTGGMEPNSPVNRAALEQYLRRGFLLNKPYNQLVYELISAQGANRPGEQDYNGAVNFLLAHLQEKAAPATAKTAQLFLGVQVQCTQCHNHPFNQWKQNRFWELNAFFRQMREERQREGNQLALARLVDGDFLGEGGDAAEAEVYFEQRNGILQVAYPTFIDGTAIDPNGLVSQVDRRRELARMVVRSNEMKLALVNRLWAQFLGYGFTKPVDDLGPHNPPSHPELLARLADEFGGHGYDLRRLIRWIVLSDAYALSSKYGSKLGNAADDPSTGTPPLFSHFYVRQMSAEQLYESLLVATGDDRTEGGSTEHGYAEQQRLKDQWLEQFAIAFGTDENDEATTFDGTITQTLVMMNGDLTRKATSGETGSFLADVARKTDRRNPLNELYLAALARRPSRAEVQVANGLLTAQSGDSASALEDIWWALLNSNEFILNH